MSKGSISRQPGSPLSVGNVVSAGLRIYRDHFKSYFGLAVKAMLWGIIPIYGWAKSYQIQAIISRQVFQELVNQPESVSTTRTQLNDRFWGFWIAQLLIGLLGFAFNIALSIVAGLIVGIPLGILVTASGGSSDNLDPTTGLIVAIVQNIVNLITIIVYIWFYSHFFVAELPLSIENNMNSTSCIGRSWQLTKGFVVRIQSIIFLAGLITLPIFLLGLTPLSFMIGSLVDSSSTNTLISSILLLLFWVIILVTISSTLMMPFWQAIKAVIYYDIRNRKEGMGLQIRDSRP